MTTIPPSIRALCNRFKSNAALTRRNSCEAHDLGSLAQRVMLSRGEVLEQIAAGRLLAIDGPLNKKYLFTSSSLDRLRNSVVEFVATEIASELSTRGVDLERIEMAVGRGLGRQHDLSSRAEHVVEFAQTNDDSFYGNAKKTAGTAAGVAAAAGAGYLGYKGYQAWRNRRNADGTPRLPGPNGSGPDSDGNYIDVTPKPPRDPNGSAQNIGVAGVERHPQQLPEDGPSSRKVAITTASPAPNIARQTAGQIAGQDALGQAVRKGKQAIAARGSSILRAIRGAI